MSFDSTSAGFSVENVLEDFLLLLGKWNDVDDSKLLLGDEFVFGNCAVEVVYGELCWLVVGDGASLFCCVLLLLLFCMACNEWRS